MQAIKCELCGSSDIMKQDGFFQCQNCGTKYNLEEARKLIGVVKIDKSEDVENLITLAKRYFDENNYAESEKYFELALRDTPNNWEVSFYRAYTLALLQESTNVDEAFSTLAKGVNTTLKIIQEHIDPAVRPITIKSFIALVIKSCSDFRQLMKNDNKVDWWTYKAMIKDTSALYDQLEQFLKQNYKNETDIIRMIQESYYEIVNSNPDEFKWSERKKLISRLNAELGNNM